MGAQLACNSCHEPIDWFSVAKKQISENFMASAAFAPIGAKSNFFDFQIEAEKSTTLTFSDYGIPKGARIFHINFTPQGGPNGALFPIESHGNSCTPYRNWADQITLFPQPIGPNPPQNQTISAGVAWITPSDSDTAFMSLVAAFEFFAAEKYKDAIVPANVAVESMLAQFFSTYLEKHLIPAERTRNFLESAATYSHQLNVLLPLICSIAELPKLPEEIREKLNRLRSFRNQVGHHGKTKGSLNKNEMAGLLTAALFGYRYVQLLQLAAEGNAPSLQPAEED